MDPLAARVHAVLEQRGIGRDALDLVDNLVRHEPGPPAATPALVRELLARPLAAGDAQSLFARAVPEDVLAIFASPPRARFAFDALLAAYIAEVGEAQKLLRDATAGAAVDAAGVLKEMEETIPLESLQGLPPVSVAALKDANRRFVGATARFAAALRQAGPLAVPDGPRRFDSAIGIVSIGTRGDDRHGADAALIIDPGGDDQYERATLAGGAVSVIVDFGGADSYGGTDVVLHGFSALVDFSGDDRYAMRGPGLGAAIVGASVLVDFSGNDAYEGGFFSQGAAAFGLGVLLDLEGDDRYQVLGGGQGFGIGGGTGLLWDRAGADRYSAAGPPDPYGRGGGISFAQGAAFGHRNMLAGGIGILRDDSGDDLYEAQMFAQGTGYYYGLGMLWDLGGNDTYRAARYGQGNGVHEAVGVLRDEAGRDRYVLEVGVGQGMGLDLAVGVLYDAGGDDAYRAGIHAQGNATGNGIGVLFDDAGSNEFDVADTRAWGAAEGARGLPSFGVLVHEPRGATFRRKGEPSAPPSAVAMALPVDAAGERDCPPAPDAVPRPTTPFVEAVRSLEFLFRNRPVDPATHAYVQQRLTAELDHALGELPPNDFVISWLVGNLVPCALRQASAGEAQAMWGAMQRLLDRDAPSAFAFAMASALRERRPPGPEMERLLAALRAHPSCAVRAAALSLEGTAPAARAALASSCWRVQATALGILRRTGEPAPPGEHRLPSFLRPAQATP